MRKTPLLLAAAALPFSLFAADIVRNGESTSLNNTTAWINAVAPTANDVAVWNETSALTATANALGSNVSWQGIRASGLTGALSLGNNAANGIVMTLGTAGIDLSAAGQNVTITNAISLGASQTWTVAGGKSLTLASLNNGRSISGAVGTTLTLAQSGTGVANFNFHPATGGTGFSDNNSFAGFAGNWSIGPNVKVTNYRNGATAWGTGTIGLNGGAIASDGGNWTWTNAIALGAGTESTVSLASGNDRYLKLQGVISGSGDVVFNNLGSNNENRGTILTGTNTMSGRVTIAAGATLRVGGVTGNSDSISAGTGGTLGTATVVNNGTLTLSRSDTHTVSNNISGTGAVRIGAGVAGANTQVVTLAGVNTYTGATTVSTGRLNVTGSLVSNVSIASGATLGGTGTLAGLTTLQAGAKLAHAGTGDGLNFTGGVTFTGATSIVLDSQPAIGAEITLFRYAGTLSGLNLLTSIGRYTLNDTGSAVLYTQGKVDVSTWNTGSDSGDWNFTSTNWSNTVDNKFANGDSAVFNSALPSVSINMTESIIASSVTFHGATDYTLRGNGALTGASSLVKNGAGKLIIENKNTHTGGTTVNEGTLVLKGDFGGAGVLGGTITANSGATVEVDGINVLGFDGNRVGTINLNGATLTQTRNRSEANTAVINMADGAKVTGTQVDSGFDMLGNAALNSTGNLTNTFSAKLNLRKDTVVTVANGAADVDLLISGAVSGTYKLIKLGEGTLTLSGTNSYTNGTELQGGRIIVNAMNGLGTGYLAVKNNATFQYDGLGAETDGRTLWFDNGAANVHVTNASASLTLSGTTGAISGGTFTKSGAGALTISGMKIGGNGGLNVTGGTLTLTKLSDYAGNTEISGGTLNLTGGAGIYTAGKAGANSLRINNGGVLVGDRWTWGNTGSLGQLNYNTGYIAVDNGTIRNVAAGSVDFANRGIAVGAGGITFDNASAGTTWRINGGGNNNTYATGARVTLTGVGNGSFEQVVSGAGVNVAKTGSGTWTLTAANTFAGGTVINAGTLVTGHAQALGTGDVTVAGGTLQIGDGTANSVTLGSGANLVVESGATLKIGSFDSLITLSAGGSFHFAEGSILDLGGLFDTASGSRFTLITGGAGENSFQGSIVGYDSARLGMAYFANDGTLNFSAIPEPSTYGLMGAGALGAIALVRRRRKASSQRTA